jgi:aspartyl-tRNA(Asn)/glutamyl-tRNA(Gln) amidotransferase subunit C
MAAITKEEVLELALLARLRLGDEEAERLRGDLSAVLGYVEKLAAVDTSGVEPMTHAVPLVCPERADTIAPSLPVDEALAAAPQRIDDFFAVPRIIEVDR